MTALKTMPGSLTSEQKLENFLTYLARHRDLAASNQNQAFHATAMACVQKGDRQPAKIGVLSAWAWTGLQPANGLETLAKRKIKRQGGFLLLF